MVGDMWKYLKRFGAWFLLFVGILWLPKDVQDYPEALQPWEEHLAMVDRENLLIAFCVILLIWLFWSDVRPFVEKKWLRKSRLETFEKPDGWSISFGAGTSMQVIAGPHYHDRPSLHHTIRIRGIRFSNLSKTYNRFIDISLRIKSFRGGEDIIMESKENSRDDDIKTFPLEIRSLQTIECGADFDIPREIRTEFDLNFVYTWDMEDVEFICSEQISRDSRTIYFGEMFDAYRNTKMIIRSSESKIERLKMRGMD